MADKKISALTTLTQANVAGTADFLPIVDTSATETKKATPEAVVLGTLGATTANVGIGTASPLFKLHVAQSSSAVVFGQDGTTPTVIGTNTAGTGSGALSLRGFPLTFTGNGASGAEQMRLDSSGNLGIGTASPTYRIDTVAGAGSGNIARFGQTGVSNGYTITTSGTALTHEWATAGSVSMKIDANANIVAGTSAALATTATDGFLYVPTCAGTPTGVPTAITGMAPIVVNTTNNKLYFYSGGAWRDAGP